MAPPRPGWTGASSVTSTTNGRMAPLAGPFFWRLPDLWIVQTKVDIPGMLSAFIRSDNIHRYLHIADADFNAPPSLHRNRSSGPDTDRSDSNRGRRGLATFAIHPPVSGDMTVMSSRAVVRPPGERK